jgi:hypothetical protein
MSVSALIILIAWLLAFGRDAGAQALTESVLLNSQSAQAAANAGRQMPQAMPKVILPGMPAAGTAAQGQTTGKLAVSDAQRSFPDCGCAREPFFSVNSGDKAAGTSVVISSPIPNAAIYYTSDGWTPTEASPRYTGPIPIHADTRLQAIAFEPGKLPSAIAEASYTVNGMPAPKPEHVVAVGGVLLKGTALRLVTGEDVSSDAAQVGDRIRLLLDENVLVGETVVAARGSAVEGTITRVERAGEGGKPGVIAFEVKQFNAHGIPVPLGATLTLAAPDQRAQKVSNASLVHVAGSLPHGDEAEIEPGMVLTAAVGADTVLHP